MDSEAFASNINNSDSQIFKNIKYYVAGDVPEKVQDILRNGGAEKLCYFSDFVTHMICGKEPTEDDLSSARELYEIPAVRWQWVLACAKLNKLVDTRGFIVSETNLFYKLIFSFSNVTAHDRNLLWALITYNGGIVQLNFDSNCTHLITTVAKGAKYEKALKCDTIKVVTPDWLLNTVNSKQIAPYDAYHPRKLVVPPPPPPPQVPQPPPQVTTSVTTEISTTPTAQITGFEPTELPTTSTSNQAILDQLKQRMPWNQQTTTTSLPSLPSNQSRPMMPSPQQHQRNFQLISTNQPQFTAAVTTAIANMTQQKAALLNQQSLQNKINQQIPTSIQQATTQQILTTMSNQIQHLKQQQLQAQAANQQQLQVNQQQLLPQLTQVTQQNLISQSNQLQQQSLNQIQQNSNSQQILNQQNQSNQIQQQTLNQPNQMQQNLLQQNQIQQNQIIQQSLNQAISQQNQQALNQQNQQAINQQNQQTLNQQNQQVLNQQNQQTLNQQNQQALNQQNQQVLNQQNQQTLNQQNQQNQLQQQQVINQQNQLQQQQTIQQQQNQLQQAINQQNQLQQQAINQQNQLQQHQALNQQNQLQQQALNQQNQIQQQNLVNQQVINQQNIILKTSQGLPTSVSSQQLLQSQMANSFQRSQLQGGNTVHHQLQANQVNQQHVQAGLQRQHILQTSLGQQQLQQQQQIQQQLQQQQQQQQLIQTQQLDNQQKLTSGNNNQLLLNENQQQNFITKNQLQQQQDGSQHPALQNQKIIMSTAQQIQQQSSMITTSQQSQLLQNNNVIQHQQITSAIGQLQANQQQGNQNQQTQQVITQNVVGGATGPPRLATPLQRQQQLHTAQQIALNKQNNEAMIKQQRLLQQQQQLRIQQLQNSQNNQFVVQQQGTIVNRQQLPPGAVKPGTPQFVQGQPRPIGWQQQQGQVGGQPQQQILLQHRQSGLAGAIQRPPGWVGQPGQLPQRQLIQLDPQTNAQLQQMDPQQRQLFLQKIQKQRQFIMQRQVLQQQQQQQQQFAVIRGQVVAGQPQNGQWPQGAPRPTLVVQQSPTATATPALRLPVKPEESPQTEQPPLVVNAKTKTALANMLSIRLQSGGPAVEGAAVNEPSAAGTLRLMTAQHNAALQQQRRTLNNGVAVPPAGVGGPTQIRTQPQPATPVPQTPPITGPPRAHFYGHNPNLKLPPNLFLLGCVFFVVEVENFLNKEFPTWQNSIRKHGGEIETVYCGRVTHVLCESQKHGVVMQALRDTKRCVTMYWLNDVIKKKQVAPPWLAMHLPTLYPDESPGARHLIATSGFNEEDNTQIKLMINAIGARYTCYFSKHNTVLICAKPEGDKFNLARKCGIPVLNVQWLSDIMMGNLTALNQTESARFQQFNVPNPFSIDYSLNPALMHGWKMPINITQESYERVKRTASPVNPPKPKKPKLENSTNVPRDGPEPRVLFSQISNLVEYENIVARLGGSIATSAKTATHLVMPKLSRSYKLIQCVAKGAHIVPESWLKDSSTANKFISETNHTFPNIDDFNRSFNCDFNKLMLCTDRDKLFKNKIFYLTPSVFPPRQFLKDMIELSGGIVENTRRTFAQIEELNTASPHCYSIITDKDDLHLINDCLVHANSGKTSIVFNTELILSGILKQQLLFNELKFAVVILTK